jgi:hypothetical protein
MRTRSAQTSPERPQICPTSHATGMGDSSVPSIARKAIYAPVWQTQVAMTAPRSEKECPLATPSACRAQIAFVRTDPRGVLRSRHSAPWAVAGSGVESQAIRHPRPLLFAPAGPEANAFSKSLTPLENQKGEPLPEAVGDNVPQGGRSGEGAERLRTGGPVGSPPGMSVGGTAKPWQAPTPCLSDAPRRP